MRSTWFEFSWLVPEGGYKWETLTDESRSDSEPETQTVLIQCQELPTRWNQYLPLRVNTALYQEFAELDPLNMEGLLAFANRYGALGLEGRNYQSFRPPPPEHGECHGFWYEEILFMREAIRLWNAALASDLSLADRVHWQGSESVVVTSDAPGDLWSVKFSAAETPELFGLLKPGDIVKPLQCHVQRAINNKLAEHNVVAKLLWDRAMLGLHMRLTPSTLIGALWAQFAETISGGRHFRRCESCGTWFEVTTEKRADAKFCSNACRSKAYRGRKRAAQAADVKRG